MRSKNRAILARVVLLASIWALFGASCALFYSDSPAFIGEKYAVIVGINDYIQTRGSGFSDLSYSVADAVAMASLLEADGWQVLRIIAEKDEATNRYATKKNIIDAIKNAPSDLTTFLFYYSGHGASESEDAAYIAPSDADLSDLSNSTSMISSSELADALHTVSAPNKIVILDSCYSGGFVDQGDSIDAVPGNSASMQTSTTITMLFRFGELVAQNAAAGQGNSSSIPLVISAAGWAEESWEDGSYGGGHGIFTYYLLDAATTSENGLMNGDSDSDGVLSCIEAYHYTMKALEKEDYYFLPHISGGLRDFALIDGRN